MARQAKYEVLASTFSKLRGKLSKYRGLLDGGYLEFLHWLSVAETRAHAVRKEYWYQCKQYTSSMDDPQHRFNSMIQAEKNIAVLPLLDMINHR